jgi:hypothetical protein
MSRGCEESRKSNRIIQSPFLLGTVPPVINVADRDVYPGSGFLPSRGPQQKAEGKKLVFFSFVAVNFTKFKIGAEKWVSQMMKHRIPDPDP